MNKKILIISFLLLLVLSLMFLLNNSNKISEQSNKPQIATSISMVSSIIKNIVGEKYEVITIIPEGVDPHDYEPSASDQIKINESSALFYIGLGFDDWTVDTVSNNKEIKVYNVSEIESLEIIDNNPHYWLSYSNAILISKYISEKIIEIDPNLSDFINNNSISFINKLENQRDEAIILFNNIDNKNIVVEHNAYIYLTKDLNLNLLGVIKLDHEIEPLPQDIANISKLIKDNNIKSIFKESGSESSIINNLSLDLTLKIYELDAEGFINNDYLELMQYNINSLYEGLK